MKKEAHTCLAMLIIVTELSGPCLSLHHWIHSCMYRGTCTYIVMYMYMYRREEILPYMSIYTHCVWSLCKYTCTCTCIHVQYVNAVYTCIYLYREQCCGFESHLRQLIFR